jgi:hypothetical protein
LIAVPQSILADSSGKTAEFMSQVFREKIKLKLLKFEKNVDFILKSTVRKRPKKAEK